MKFWTGSNRLIKDMNTLLVLDTIRRRSPIARITLARETGLAPSTITSLTKRLIQAGVVYEDGDEPPSGQRSRGRRSVLLRFNPDVFCAVAVDLGASRTTLNLLNLEPRLLREAVVPVSCEDQSRLGDELVRAVWGFLEQEGVDRRTICGVGIGVPGIVNPMRYTVRSPVAFRWTEAVRLDAHIAQSLGVPVVVENDTNAAALAEQLYGAAQGVSDLVYVTIGDGIGAGIVVNGAVYRGAGFGAGEFGHTSVDASGPRCRCGNRGCVENYASAPALLEAFRHEATETDLASLRRLAGNDLAATGGPGGSGDRGPSLETLVRAAQAGHRLARRVIAQGGARLGQALVNVINLIDPQLIVLGGAATRMGDLLLKPLRQVVARRAGMVTFSPDRIVLSALGSDAEVKGLTALLMQRCFSLHEPLSNVFHEPPDVS